MRKTFCFNKKAFCLHNQGNVTNRNEAQTSYSSTSSVVFLKSLLKKHKFLVNVMTILGREPSSATSVSDSSRCKSLLLSYIVSTTCQANMISFVSMDSKTSHLYVLLLVYLTRIK